MLQWIIAALGGVLVALWQYGRPALTPRFALPAVLRAVATALVVALLLSAPGGRPSVITPDVALDASESWLRAAPRCDRWRLALDSASRLGGGQWLGFGDSVRVDPSVDAPIDRASRLRPVADRAAGSGRPVVVITDGELDDPDAIAALPRGSRTIVMPCAPVPDAAISTLEAPRALLAGDTVTARITVVAGGAGAPAGQVELRLDTALLATARYLKLLPYAEQTLDVRAGPGGAERAAVLRTMIHQGDDLEPRNDTLGVGGDVSRAPAAGFGSPAPDYDPPEP